MSWSSFADYSGGIHNPSAVDAAFNKRGCDRGHWSEIIPRGGSTVPCPRSMHAGAIWRSNLYIFGGYDGRQRSNDLHVYSFPNNCWTHHIVDGLMPSRRDRHTAVVYMNSLVIFGGYDGMSRVDGEGTSITLYKFLGKFGKSKKSAWV